MQIEDLRVGDKILWVNRIFRDFPDTGIQISKVVAVTSLICLLKEPGEPNIVLYKNEIPKVVIKKVMD